MVSIITLIVSILALIISIILVILLLKNSKLKNSTSINYDKEFQQEVINPILKSNTELETSINKDISSLKEIIKSFDEQVYKDISLIKDSQVNFSKEILTIESNNQKEIINKLNENLLSTNTRLQENYEKTIKEIQSQLSEINKTLSVNLESLRNENSTKLEKIQKEVTDKLDSALNERLKSTFNNVITQLDNVNKSVGEIKGIANDVGSLKNVLTNVKTKGITGEIVLGNIIDEILTKEQYITNAITKDNSKNPVEYAIKLPNSNSDKPLLLPVDSKFPTESYSRILEAIDEGDKVKLEENRKQLRNNIRAFAKDISTKYIDEGNTTPFAIMFLPIEGLYCEVINLNLFEEIQNEFKVIITGPTTFSAILNSLRLGFKTLAIQKKSADVFNLLLDVKKEFNKFAEALDQTQSKFMEVQNKLESLVGTRTRTLRKQLNNIDSLEYISNNDNEEIKTN